MKMSCDRCGGGGGDGGGDVMMWQVLGSGM